MSMADHASEVLSLLRSARVTIYDGQVPDNPTLPYVVVYFDMGDPSALTVNDASHQFAYDFQTTYVATRPDQVRHLVDKVQPELLGIVPDVYGVRCTPIAKLFSSPTRPDTDVRPPRFYAVDQWRYYANG